MKANAAQEQVINEIYGQSIVIACPGSGKTTTLLRRINHMIKDEGINPNEILMITFTKAAAKEMKERYDSQYEMNSGVTFCTIHSLCTALLRKFDGFDTNNLLASNYSIIMDIIKNDNRSRDINDLDVFVRDVSTDITVMRSGNLTVNEFIPNCCSNKKFFDDIYKAYVDEKKYRGLVDFDDLLERAYELMMSERDCLDFLRDKYAFIHVDEYQDTNFLQRDIIYAIAGLNGNITVVGDDDQSIYAFRGAKPEVMQDFLRHYPDAREIHMSTNYRSDKKIIESASNLITHNLVRFTKDIKASSKEDGDVTLKCCSSKKETVMTVASDIMKLLNNGVDASSIAILYRTNSQATPIADALMQLDIPFYSNEDIPDRYQDDMFRDILAYYKMSKKNSTVGMQDAFIRTITKPQRYFHNYTSMRYDDSMVIMKKKAYDSNLVDWKNRNTAENIEKYHKLLAFLKFLKPEQFLDALYLQGGYQEYLKHYANFRNLQFEDLEDKWNGYKEDIKKRQISSFDEWEKYGANFTRMLQKRQSERKGVCISTMHKSKGLEWDYVFIIDCVEETCPFVKATLPFEIEEERRLFYVAMTRAKHDLRLFYHRPSKRGKKVKPSRFLKESGLLIP